MRGKPHITIPDEARKRAVSSLQGYVAENLEEEIGDLRAGFLLDFILEELGPTIYNQAIGDARAFFEARASDLEGVCYHAEFPHGSKGRGP